MHLKKVWPESISRATVDLQVQKPQISSGPKRAGSEVHAFCLSHLKLRISASTAHAEHWQGPYPLQEEWGFKIWALRERCTGQSLKLRWRNLRSLEAIQAVQRMDIWKLADNGSAVCWKARTMQWANDCYTWVSLNCTKGGQGKLSEQGAPQWAGLGEAWARNQQAMRSQGRRQTFDKLWVTRMCCCMFLNCPCWSFEKHCQVSIIDRAGRSAKDE